MKIKSVLPHLLVFTLSYIVKIHRVEKGNFVTWDEAHFGKFSQKYLDRTFYFDVHPPLGKMLTALSGLIFGQSRSFDFSSKENYPTAFDFEGMRRFHAFIASFTPLFGFMILRVLRFSLRRSLLLSLLFIFENGTVSISRLILLDSHLLSFTAGTLYFLTLLHMKPKNGLGEDRTLLCLGIFLGCVMSIKWIGCLTMLHVGIYIIFDLYSKIMFMDLAAFARHFLKRAFYLIAVPAFIYVALFHLHFRIANNSGPDDGFMSSEFQLGLNNSAFNGLKKFVTYGKQVTIKSGHGYLHSHFHAYPDDGREDSNVTNNKKIYLQVSTYNHRDKNNNFYFQKVTEDSNVDFLRDGDRVVLLHSETKGYIQGTREEAYFTPGSKVVLNRESINGTAVWVVEAFSDSINKEPFIKAISTKFYLRNSATGCYLSSSQKNYPSWGFDQGEVLCKTARETDCLWNVEENFFTDSQLNPPYNELRPSFFSKFVEHQVAMFNTNKSFVQDPDIEPDRIVSKPYEWPILKKGLRMSQWHDGFKFYMFMNPLILYSTTVCLAISPIIALLKLVRSKRKATSVQGTVLVDTRSGKQSNSIKTSRRQSATGRDGFPVFLAIGGWALHYIPFYMVGRVLYLHHYFPALFMATLNICFVFKHMSFWKCNAFVFLCLGVFWLYSPLTYGFMKEGILRFLRIFDDWDFVD